MNFGKFSVYVHYTSEMCTAFGVLKYVKLTEINKKEITNYDIKKKKPPLQYTFLQLDIILLIV